MAARTLPPQDFLRECFDYSPETGEFRWKHRPDHHFDKPEIAASWNSRLAGRKTFLSVAPGRYGGYLLAEVVYDGSRYHLRANRVAWKMMTGEEHEMIDHRDLDVANNRFANLRASDRFGNRHNAPGSHNHPLPKGVSLERGRFRAQGHVGRCKINLGSFGTPAEAHAAYCAWARPLHGEFFNPGPEKLTVFD